MANENQIIIGAGQDTAHRAPKKEEELTDSKFPTFAEVESHVNMRLGTNAVNMSSISKIVYDYIRKYNK